MTRSDGQLDCLLGARRGANRRVPKLANMTGGVTTPILNPESVSRYEGLDEVRRCQAADARQKTKKTTAFSWNRWLKLIPKHITVPLTVHKHRVITGSPYYEFYTIFPVFI